MKNIAPLPSVMSDHGGSRPQSKSHTPSPPKGRRLSSAHSRPASRSFSRASSTNSRGSQPDVSKIMSQQASFVSQDNEICYEYLPQVTKPASTIGRHHTIVPPIAVLSTDTRPMSRAVSTMSEVNLALDLRSGGDAADQTHDDLIIHSVHQENTPSGTPRLPNPLEENMRIIPTPLGYTNNNSALKGGETDSIIRLTPPPEPPACEPRRQLAIKLPTGERLLRYFSPTDCLSSVLAFIAQQTGNLEYTRSKLRTATRAYADMSSTLEQCSIEDKTSLFIEFQG